MRSRRARPDRASDRGGSRRSRSHLGDRTARVARRGTGCHGHRHRGLRVGRRRARRGAAAGAGAAVRCDRAGRRDRPVARRRGGRGPTAAPRCRASAPSATRSTSTWSRRSPPRPSRAAPICIVSTGTLGDDDELWADVFVDSQGRVRRMLLPGAHRRGIRPYGDDKRIPQLVSVDFFDFGARGTE